MPLAGATVRALVRALVWIVAWALAGSAALHGGRADAAPAAEGLIRAHNLLSDAERALAARRPQEAQARLAEAEALAGDFAYARMRLRLLGARTALALGQAGRAVELARQALELASPEDTLQARLVLAQALELDGRLVEATHVLVAAIQSPSALFGGSLRDELVAWARRLAEQLPGSTPQERAALAEFGRALTRFGRHEEAVAFWSGRRWEELQPEATVHLGRSLAALRQFERRLQVLEEELARARAAGAGGAALAPLRLQLAEEYRRRGLPQQAEEQLLAVLREDPQSPSAGQALWNLVRWRLEDAAGDAAEAPQSGQTASGGADPGPGRKLRREARALLERYGPQARSTPGWREALWTLFALSQMEAGSAQAGPAEAGLAPAGDDAAEDARWALDQILQGLPDDGPALYWSARLSGRAAAGQARAHLERLHRSAPFSYHALAARERWPQLAPDLDCPPEQSPSPAPGSPLPAIVALRDAGQRDAALGELRYLVRSNPQPGWLALLARWEQEAGRFRQSMGRAAALAARCTVGLSPAGTQAAAAGGAGPATESDPPPAWVELWFPRPFRQQVEAAAAVWGVDPALVYAVMREESAFEAGAYSPAGAHGLMQLMAPTAAWMAEQLGWPAPSPAELFAPERNVQLGTAYLAYLLRRYGDRRLAVAAYHAGPGRVDAWLRRWPASPDPEAWVEAIPIPATRQYVYQVERSWRVYRWLYDPRTAPLGPSP